MSGLWDIFKSVYRLSVYLFFSQIVVEKPSELQQFSSISQFFIESHAPEKKLNLSSI